MSNKIYYVEPNNLMNSSLDNIPYNVEDYTISMDLQVTVPSRDKCGIGSDDDIVYGLSWYSMVNQDGVKNDNISHGKTSFMGGSILDKSEDGKNNFIKSNMFSTSYTDMSYDNITNPDIIKEGLGISSIDIDFDNYFYPKIVIKFIDVRGISLLAPEEVAFRKSVLSGSDTYESASFFKSLFTFPYPVFTLRVKGFYGNPITLTLALSTFNAIFNAEDGHFEITASFVGYMFGLLNELPMNYILSAPYDEYYGKDYWDSRNFTFDDGRAMPTFIELIERIQLLNSELPQISNTNPIIIAYKTLTKELDALKDIEINYNIFKETISNKIIGDSNILFLVNNTNVIKDNNNSRTSFYNKILDYNKNYSGTLPLPNYDTNNTIEYTPVKLFDKKVNNLTNEVVITKTGDYVNILKQNKWFERIESDVKLKSLINNSINKSARNNIMSGLHAYLFQDNNFSGVIRSKIEGKTIELTKLKERLDEEQRNIGNDILKFTPSIRNVVKLILAHVDTFMNTTYRCMGNIKSSGRTMNQLGIPPSNIDVNKPLKGDVFIPPFPTYYAETNNNGGMEERWIGEINSGVEEVKLINGFIKGVTNTNKELNDITESIISNTTPSNFIPLNINDMVNNQNPYSGIFKDSKTTSKIDELVTHFILRVLPFLSRGGVGSLSNDVIRTEDNDDSRSKVAGKVEALNFLNSVTDIDNILLTELESAYLNDNQVIDFINGNTSDNILINETGQPIYYQTNTPNKQLFEKKIVTEYYNRVYTKVDTCSYVWINKLDTPVIPFNFNNIRSINNNIVDFNDNMVINNLFYTPYDPDLSDDILFEYVDNTNINLYSDNIPFVNHQISIEDNELLTDSEKKTLINNWDCKKFNFHKYYRNDSINGYKNVNDDLVVVSDTNSTNEERGVIPSTYNSDELPLFTSKVFKKPKGFWNRITFNNNYQGDDNVESSEDFIESLLNSNVEINYNKIFQSELKFDAGTLFGHPFYYTQNTASNEVSIYNKAILFLCCQPTFSKETIKQLVDELTINNRGKRVLTIPKSIILLLGGLLWRERTIKSKSSGTDIVDDTFLYDELIPNIFYAHYPHPEIKKGHFVYEYLPYDYNCNTDNNIELDSRIFKLRESIKNKFIKYFTQWVNNRGNGFKQLINSLELKLKYENNNIVLTGAMLQNIINSFHRYDNRTNELMTTIYTKITLTEEIKIDMLPTLWGFIKNTFSDNLINNYQKLIRNGEGSHTSFILLNRPSSVAINQLTEFSVDDVTITLAGGSYFNTVNNDDIYVTTNALKAAFTTFKNTIIDVAKKTNINTNNTINIADTELAYNKLSVYNMFKNLYNRWLCSNNIDKWVINDNDNGSNTDLYRSFEFIDSFYNDIGDNLMVNVGKLCDSLIGFRLPTNEDVKVYHFIGSICRDNNMQFMSLPILTKWSSLTEVENMFKPQPSNNNIGDLHGHKHVCMYTYEPSIHLDINNSNNYTYKNDGFSIADANGNVIETTDGVNLGSGAAFAVSYAKQNQSFFQNIEIGMESSQVTGESLYNTQYLAKNFGKPGREISFSGQDLFPIYANRMYTCTVTMMGCAQIVPLMYFQLNNIPMFRGVYQIIKVSHSITEGDMKTTFVGLRLNRNKIPFNTEIFNIGSLIDASGSLNNAITVDINEVDENGNTMSILENISIVEGNNLSYSDISKLKDSNGNPLIIFEQTNPESGYNKLAQHMKKLLYSIAMTTKQNNCDYKIRVTSMGRDTYGTNKSDHGYTTDVNSKNISERRRLLNLTDSCAIDIHGCDLSYTKGSGGIKSKSHSIELFQLISSEFTPYIRQLIWEDDNINTISDNSIDNAIHLSSYGYGHTENSNDTLQIFEAYGDSGKFKTTKLNNNGQPSLSPKFYEICKQLIDSNKVTKNNLINFSNMDTNSFNEILG